MPGTAEVPGTVEVLEIADRREAAGMPEAAERRAEVLEAADSRLAGMLGTVEVLEAAGMPGAVIRMVIGRLCRMAGVLLWSKD